MKQFDEILMENLAHQEDKLVQVYENRFALFESNITALLKNKDNCLCHEREVRV